MKPPLSDKRRRIVLFIGEYIREHKISPSVREMRDAAGYSKSTLCVVRDLRILRDAGYLTYDDYKGRTVVLTDLGNGLIPKPEPKVRSVPILNSAGLRVLAARMREKDAPVAWLGGEA